jgi:hypothetical protein
MKIKKILKTHTDFLLDLQKNIQKNSKFLLLGLQAIELPIQDEFIDYPKSTKHINSPSIVDTQESSNEYQNLFHYLKFVKQINKKFKKETDYILEYASSHVSKSKQTIIQHLQEENKDVFLLFKIHLEQREDTFYHLLKKKKIISFTYDHQKADDVLKNWKKMSQEKFFYIFPELMEIRKKAEKTLGKEHTFVAKQYIHFHKDEPKLHL